MAEVKSPAGVIARRYMCDECGEEMKRMDGYMYASMPPQYDHVCANGHVKRLFKSYPYFDFVVED